jgi:hypothetical protein
MLASGYPLHHLRGAAHCRTMVRLGARRPASVVPLLSLSLQNARKKRIKVKYNHKNNIAFDENNNNGFF